MRVRSDTHARVEAMSGGFAGRCIDVMLVNDDVEVEGETVTIRCWAGGEDDET